jgi:hypothetical protein
MILPDPPPERTFPPPGSVATWSIDHPRDDDFEISPVPQAKAHTAIVAAEETMSII